MTNETIYQIKDSIVKTISEEEHKLKQCAEELLGLYTKLTVKYGIDNVLKAINLLNERLQK